MGGSVYNTQVQTPPSKRPVLILWLIWAAGLLLYQGWVVTFPQAELHNNFRQLLVDPERPQEKRIYLDEPFLNQHVAWDSMTYLSIAAGGYDNPLYGMYRVDVEAGRSQVAEFTPRGGVSRSAAFLPLYPLLMRLLALPLHLLGLPNAPALVLSGVLLSLLGSLAAALALYDISQPHLSQRAGLRAVLFLLIFPGALFLAQVYTEALFTGLAFSSLALMRRRHWLAAGVIAALATLTRSMGFLLLVPMGVTWLQAACAGQSCNSIRTFLSAIGRGFKQPELQRLILAALLPAGTFIAWFLSPFGQAFLAAERLYFDRHTLALGLSLRIFVQFVGEILGGNWGLLIMRLPEIIVVILTGFACLALLRRYPAEASFSLLVWVFALTSIPPALTMLRYALPIPALFLYLAELGERKSFTLGWSLFSAFLLILLVTLFTFDIYAG